LTVAKALREKFPPREIVIAADDDAWTDNNPGLTEAREAANTIGARLVVPRFKDTSTNPTDFNDLQRLQGLQAVKQQIESRIAKLTSPVQPVSLEQWRTIIKANFPTLLRPAETCLSVLAQLLLNDVSNPFCFSPCRCAASGKTITLNFFDGPIELTYTTDNFTPASFVSHASNVKREDLGNVDLLPRIRYRTTIVRELGSIFGANTPTRHAGASRHSLARTLKFSICWTGRRRLGTRKK
jgi:hypothetical protein